MKNDSRLYRAVGDFEYLKIGGYVAGCWEFGYVSGECVSLVN